MAVAAGIEPTTCSLGESRSIQLSYATASVSLQKNIWIGERPIFRFICLFRAFSSMYYIL